MLLAAACAFVVFQIVMMFTGHHTIFDALVRSLSSVANDSGNDDDIVIYYGGD